MKKKNYCPLLAVLLMMLFAFPVYAKEEDSNTKWLVEYKNGKLNSNFTTSDISNSMNEMQPGDSAEFSVVLRNSDGKAVDWYMTNEVISSLEDGSDASDGAYTYMLYYYGSSGDPVELFNSESVGGDAEQIQRGRSAEDTEGGNRQGLHDEALDPLKQYLYLERLNSGKEAKVVLTIGLDGETQRNVYMDTDAQISLNFAVEQDPPDEVIRKTRKSGGGSGGGQPGNDEVIFVPGTVIEIDDPTAITSVKTGDTARLGFWLMIMLLSGGAMAALLIYDRKSRGKGGGLDE